MARSVKMACGVLAGAACGFAVASVVAQEPALELMLTDAERHEHSARPQVGTPQRPELSNAENSDAGKPVWEWDHLTGDWGGLRPTLDDRGIVIDADITIDWSKNLRGGLNNNGDSFRHLFNFNLTLDTERLGFWPGGVVFFNFQNHNGENGTEEEVGDLQGYSNIDADGRTQLSELWYEQTLFEGVLRLKLGKIDANSEFAFVDHGGEFLNSSFGFSPTILGITSYPDPAGGLVVFVQPCEFLYAGFGVFDGAAQEGITTGSRGIKTLFGDPADLFLIGEIGVTWTLGDAALAGRAAVGFWRHTGTFERLAGGNENGTEGFYIVADQQICRENPADDEDSQGLGFFFQYGYADADVSEIEHHIGGGFAWTGPIPTRDEDVFGVGFTTILLSDDGGFDESNETTIELFYKVQVTPAVSVKPDVQYISNPSGGATRDVIVATVRVEIAF